MWGEVTPAERLRAVTRRNVADERLAAEAAGALAGFADEPRRWSSRAGGSSPTIVRTPSSGGSAHASSPPPSPRPRPARRSRARERSHGRPLGSDAAVARRRRDRRRHRLAVGGRRRVDGTHGHRRRPSASPAPIPPRHCDGVAPTTRSGSSMRGIRRCAYRPPSRPRDRDRSRACAGPRGSADAMSVLRRSRARCGWSAASAGYCPPCCMRVCWRRSPTRAGRLGRDLTRAVRPARRGRGLERPAEAAAARRLPCRARALAARMARELPPGVQTSMTSGSSGPSMPS